MFTRSFDRDCRLCARISKPTGLNLQALTAGLDIGESGARKIGGWVAAQATALKIRLDDSADGPLRLFEGLEFLSLGISQAS